MPPDLLTLLSQHNIVIFVIIFTRIAGMMAAAPLFSGYPIPPQMKIWLVSLIAFIMFPIVASTIAFKAPSAFPDLIVYLLREFGVGFMIGFIANLIFAAAQMGGEFISLQMGLTMAQVLDPTTGNNFPILSQMFVFLVSFTFIALNAHQWLFAAVYRSYSAIPPGLEFLFTGEIVSHILHLSAQMFIIAISMILPVFCVMFTAEVLMGFTSKMIPQMNIFMVAIPLKIFVGMSLILMFLPPMVSYLANMVQSFLKGIVEMMI